MTEQERAKASEENYKRMRKQLDDRLNADIRLKQIAEKIKTKKADFKDTAEYSEIVSKHISEVIQDNVGEITMPLDKQFVCNSLLKDHYERINDVLGTVQASVDEKLGIHIAPQKAPFPLERVIQVAHSLEDPTVPPETIVRRAGAPVENVAKSFHDDYIKENAKFRNDAGLKCYLVRTTDGKCCDWCTKIAGRYDYATAPDDIFRRHDNCGCTTIYENGRQRQNVWTKKTWEVPEIEDKEYKPTVFNAEQAKALEKKNLRKYHGLTEENKGGIIKNIKLSDVENALSVGNIKHEIGKTIIDVLSESNSQYLFDKIIVQKLDAKIVMQTTPVKNGTFFDVQLILNENFLGGKTVEQLDAIFSNSDYTVANTFRDAVIHEKYHAKLIDGLNYAQLEALYDELSEIHIDGISKTAWKDGSECIAETGVLFEREDVAGISTEAKILFDKYLGVKL